VDYEAVGNSPLIFKRRYNSSIARRNLLGNLASEYWRHNYLAKINYLDIPGNIQANAVRSNGQTITFILNNSVYVPDADISMSLTKTSTGWQLIDEDDSIETYDLTGKLLSISDHKGNIVRLSYNTKGQLSSVSDAYSRVLIFSYNTTGQLIGFTNPLGYTTRYTYDTNKRLSSVIYPDSRTKQYVYENTQYLFALTGIINESNQRTATWTYDTTGRATSSSNANGVDKTTISYGVNQSSVALLHKGFLV
jgi:YD repeat-containing protein